MSQQTLLSLPGLQVWVRPDRWMLPTLPNAARWALLLAPLGTVVLLASLREGAALVGAAVCCLVIEFLFSAFPVREKDWASLTCALPLVAGGGRRAPWRTILFAFLAAFYGGGGADAVPLFAALLLLLVFDGCLARVLGCFSAKRMALAALLAGTAGGLYRRSLDRQAPKCAPLQKGV